MRRILPRLSLLLLAPAQVFIINGAVIPGDGGSVASLTVEVTQAGGDVFAGSDFDSTLPDELPIASIGGPEVSDDQGQQLLAFNGFVTGRHFVVRDEGDFMRFIASANIDLAYGRLAALSSDTINYTGTASASFSFEVTDAAMNVSLGWSIGSDFGQGFEPSVSLTRDGDLEPIYEFPPASGDPDPGTGFIGSLAPGTYSVGIQLPIVAANEPSLRQDLAFSMAVGEEPDQVPLPAPGDFTHPDLVTARDGAGVLDVVAPSIVSETPQGDGTTEIRLTASVENLRSAPWPEVQLGVAGSVEGEPDIEVISLPAPIALATGETAAVPGEVVLRVADADLPAARAALLDGSRFRLSGAQQPVFVYPVRPLGAVDFEDAPPGSPANSDGLNFPYAPAIGSGTLWLEWEPFYKVPPIVLIEDPGGIAPPYIERIQGRDQALPVLVKDVLRTATNFQLVLFDPDDPNQPGGRVPLSKVMKEGQAVDLLRFEGHPDGLGVTEDPESRYTSNGLSLGGLFPAPVPFHFNRLELSPGVEVSGSFGFRPDELAVNLEMNGFQIEALEVTARYRADCNLLLETSEGADNSAEPLAGRTGTLLDLPLLKVNLSNGFTFEPRLVLKAGALISAPTSLSIPVTAGLDVMVMAGVRDGAPVYDSDFTPIPLQVSDPGLYEALGATAEAFIDCEIKALIGAAGNLVQSGPTLGAKAAAEFALTPLDDPWWSADAELSTYAGAEFNLAGILTLADAEQTLQTWPLLPFFPLSADGPLISPPAARTFDPQPGFEALGAPNTRWSRTLLADPGGQVQDRTAATVLADGDILATSSAAIARLSPAGELRWSLDTNSQLMAGAAVAEPDGGFTALSIQRNVIRLARFDAAGTVLWSRAVSGADGVAWFETRGLARRETAGGASEYYVLGQGIGSSAGGFHPSLVKLDSDGNVVWGKIYPVPPLAAEGINSDPGGLCITAAGDVVVAGDTTADLESAGTLGNITRNGLVFKVDGDSGEVVWSTLVAEADTVRYSAVSEGPDGSIYAGGNSRQGVTSENPSMLLVKLNADGSLVDSVLVGSAETNVGLPHGGETVYDEIRDMAWADGQLWICGQIGLFNAGSVGGVAEGASAFTAMVSEQLDVSRFVIHAGPATDAFETIEATPHGLLVSGFSASFHPWPSGASDEGQGNPGALWVAMLPWEGRLRFHAASAARQNLAGAPNPDAGSYFATPRVRATSQYTLSTNQSLFAGLSQDNLTASGSDSRPVIAEAFTPNEALFTLAPTPFDPEEYKSLEFIPESLITDLNTHLQWWQLESGEDSDSDGLPAEAEFFLGTSPGRPDFGVITFEYLKDLNGEPAVRFTLPRSTLAAPALPTVQSNADLTSNFGVRMDVDARTEPLDSTSDRLILELPAPEPSQFFRLEFPK